MCSDVKRWILALNLFDYIYNLSSVWNYQLVKNDAVHESSKHENTPMYWRRTFAACISQYFEFPVKPLISTHYISGTTIGYKHHTVLHIVKDLS